MHGDVGCLGSSYSGLIPQDKTRRCCALYLLIFPLRRKVGIAMNGLLLCNRVWFHPSTTKKKKKKKRKDSYSCPDNVTCKIQHTELNVIFLFHSSNSIIVTNFYRFKSFLQGLFTAICIMGGGFPKLYFSLFLTYKYYVVIS